MRRTPAVIFNVTGQSISLRVPQGRPTSATFQVFRAWAIDESTAEFSGSASIDTPNTTTTAAAGPTQTDPQKIALASTAGIAAGSRYLLAANGIKEWVVAIDVEATFIRVREALQYDYPSGATFQSTIISAAIDATWIADRSKLSDLSDSYPDFRIRWAIVVAGATVVINTMFDVVRAQASHHVEIDDVNARAPGLSDSLPIEYRAEDGRPLIDAAWSLVRAHLQAMNISVDAIREEEALDELVLLAALRVIAEAGWKPAAFSIADYVHLTTNNYDRYLEQHFGVLLKHRMDYQLGPLSTVEQLRRQVDTPYWSK